MAALFRTEMVKQWRRSRTYLVLATTVVVPVVIAIALKVNPPTVRLTQGPLERFPLFVTRTGLFLPVVALQFTSQFLLVLIVALFAGDVVANLALASAYVLWSVAGVGALAFLASTMTDSPSGALFAGFGLYVVSQILNNIASLDPVSFVFPTHYQNSWTALFVGNGPTRNMLHGVLLQVPYVVVFGGSAWWYFRRKDVLS